MALFTKRKSAALAGIAVAALALTACGGGDGSTPAAPGGGSGVTFDVAKDVAISGSPAFDKMKSAGTIKIGVKEDQPNLGYKNAATNERTGFDIEMATWMAASLGFPKDKIEFKPIDSAARESAIANGDVDLYVGTYSITDKRKTQVGFVGPYFVTGQGLLVKKDSSIASEKDLDGKTVCSATGSTPLQNIQQNFPKVKATSFDKYSQCVDALKAGQVDAVTTDQAILIGYAAQSPDDLKVVGEPFTTEKYGIGIPKGDKSLCEAMTTTLKDGNATWTKIYDDTLGKSGTKVEQPTPDACS